MPEQIPLKAVKSGGVATALAEMAVGDYAAPIYLPPIFTDYVSGLVLAWISGTSISVSAGACYVPSLGYVLAFPATVTKSGLSLTASTWYHVYGYLNGSTPDVEVVTAAPSSIYNGRARTKTGDTSRRYLGSVLTNSSGAVIRFTQNVGQYMYSEGIYRILQVGATTDFTVASLAPQVPVTARVALVAMTNSSSTAPFRIRPVGYANSLNTRMYGLPGNAYVVGPLPLTDSQTYEYQVDTNGSGNLDVLGFYIER